jgi:hypothetical protein
MSFTILQHISHATPLAAFDWKESHNLLALSKHTRSKRNMYSVKDSEIVSHIQAFKQSILKGPYRTKSESQNAAITPTGKSARCCGTDHSQQAFSPAPRHDHGSVTDEHQQAKPKLV